MKDFLARNKGFIIGALICLGVVWALPALAAVIPTPTPPIANTLLQWINLIAKAILGLAGFIALLYLVIGGIKYITSAGNPEGVKSATDQILYAIIGIIVIAISWAAVTYVIKIIEERTPTPYT